MMNTSSPMSSDAEGGTAGHNDVAKTKMVYHKYVRPAAARAAGTYQQHVRPAAAWAAAELATAAYRKYVEQPAAAGVAKTSDPEQAAASAASPTEQDGDSLDGWSRAVE
ncbi:MAG: hypothetical protein M3Y73_08665 [Actinomycetota bacterium]|nr:hypothetical protein [Actinomycetota bacterium]